VVMLRMMGVVGVYLQGCEDDMFLADDSDDD
jgi:hypothetical protein